MFQQNLIAQPCPLVTFTTVGVHDICVGNTQAIHCTGGGNASESWTSSATGVATVAGTGGAGSGAALITSVSAGSTTISYKIGGVTQCTYLISVDALPSAPTISGVAPVCNTGGTVTLSGSPSGGGWLSLNTSIATVGSLTGVVTGVSAGTVTVKYIIISAHGCTASSTVTETVDPTPTGGSISGNVVIWATAGASGTCTLTSGGTGGGTWTSVLPGIAGIGSSTGVVSGISAGTTTISYTTPTNSCGTAYATTVVTVDPMPYGPDGTPTRRAHSRNILTGLNVAMLELNPPGGYSGGELAGFATWDGTSANFYITDVTGSLLDASPGVFSLTGTPNNTPDIALGNVSGTTPGLNSLAACAYSTGSGVFIDVFNVYTDGVNCSVNPTPVATYTCTGTPNAVHIDVIADFSILVGTANPMPMCEYAVATWEDGGTVYAAEFDMQGGGGTLSTKNIDNGKDPDVAATKRYVSGSLHDFALLTYTDAGNGNLYYREWDITANTLSSIETLDAMGMGSTVSIPRIDAIDDANTNDPTSGNAVWKVAAQVYNNSSGHYEVRSYDNVLYGGSPAYWAPTSTVSVDFPSIASLLPYDHYAPTVAVAGTQPGYVGTPTLYNVQQFTEFVSSATTYDVVLLEPIDYTVSTAFAAPGHGYYYWVSDNFAHSVSTIGVYANAIASTANVPGDFSVSAWVYPAAMGGGTDLKYVYQATSVVGSYDYKPGRTITNNAAPAKMWGVYPNPVVNQVTITESTGMGGSYKITDVLGRTRMQGTVSGNVKVDLSRLPAGNYVLTLDGQNGSHEAKIFVKE